MRRKESLLSKYDVVFVERPNAISNGLDVHVWIKKEKHHLISTALMLGISADNSILSTITLPQDYLYVGFFGLPHHTYKLLLFFKEVVLYGQSYLYISAYNDRVLGELE